MKLPEASKNLVIVRAGKSSLHGGWVADKSIDRNWDIVVSYFDKDCFTAHTAADGDVPVYIEGGKWDGIFTTIRDIENIDQYDYVWLPDDDIETDCKTVNRMFEMMQEYELSIAQPSLSSDSYFSALHVVQCDDFILRHTNFVEIMIPCLRKDVLLQMLPDFEFTLSGFGLDSVWHRLDAVDDNRAAILDDISVRHTRPLGSQLRSKVIDQGTTPRAEGVILRSKYDMVPMVFPLTYQAIDKDGVTVSDTRQLAHAVALNRLRTDYKTLSVMRAWRKVIRLYFRQLTEKVNLSPLRRTTH